MKDFQSKDFQNVLKFIIEGDVTPTDAGAGGTTGADAGATSERPGVSLADSKNPSEAMRAFKRELDTLWGTFKSTLSDADRVLEQIAGQVDHYTADAMDIGTIDQTIDKKFGADRVRPTLDRTALAAMRARATSNKTNLDKYKPNPPAAPASTTPTA